MEVVKHEIKNNNADTSNPKEKQRNKSGETPGGWSRKQVVYLSAGFRA